MKHTAEHCVEWALALDRFSTTKSLEAAKLAIEKFECLNGDDKSIFDRYLLDRRPRPTPESVKSFKEEHKTFIGAAKPILLEYRPGDNATVRCRKVIFAIGVAIAIQRTPDLPAFDQNLEAITAREDYLGEAGERNQERLRLLRELIDEIATTLVDVIPQLRSAYPRS